MRPIRETVALEEACAIVNESIEALDHAERVSLGDAAGRVLAYDIVSGLDVPPVATGLRVGAR